MKNYKTILFLLVIYTFILSFSLNLRAQSSSESHERELLYSESLHIQPIKSLNNEVFLIQVGEANLSILIQNSNDFSGNSASIQQIGFSEEIILNQLGANNYTSINQFGSRNTAEINKIGNSISSNILQSGSGHSIQLELGTDKINYNIQQQGYNHRLIDLGFNPKSQGYSIRQSGLSGMEVIIQQR